MDAPSLGSWTFPGDVVPATQRRTSTVGEAFFDGVIGWAPWPREAVGHLLPPDLEPAPASAGPRGRHPVVVALGRQRDTAVVYGGVRFDLAIAYDECMLSVPFVRRRGGRRLHTFVALMMCGDRRATWSGNTHYGFAKRMGHVDRLGDVWTARSEPGGPAIHATTHPLGAWRRGTDDPPAVARSIARVFDAPVLGRREDGTYLASYFTWDLAGATMRPSRMGLFVMPAAVDVSTPEALEVVGMRWGLGWPEPPAL